MNGNLQRESDQLYGFVDDSNEERYLVLQQIDINIFTSSLYLRGMLL
jgi:hypothetical protein